MQALRWHAPKDVRLEEVAPPRIRLALSKQAIELRRAQFAGAGIVLIATPEYAGGMPGSLKNALDWLVGSGELYEKSVVVVSAAPHAERGAHARQWVEDVVRMQGARVLDSFTLAVQRNGPASKLAEQARALVDVLNRGGVDHPSAR